MNLALLSHEWLVIALGLGVLLADLWLPAPAKRKLGYVAALGVGAILLYSLLAVSIGPGDIQYAFHQTYVLDGLALFFKRFFLVAALLVLLMSVEYADAFQAGVGEFYALVLFALSGMLFASSVNDFALLFVSLELITVTFYVLTSFQRTRQTSLEAGVKYLILGALSTSFTVFGIALVYGISHQLNFGGLAAVAGQYRGNRLFLCGAGVGHGRAWASKSPPSRFRSGRRMSIKGRPRRPPPSWRSGPRPPGLSCSCGCSSLRCRPSRRNGPTC